MQKIYKSVSIIGVLLQMQVQKIQVYQNKSHIYKQMATDRDVSIAYQVQCLPSELQMYIKHLK